MKTLKLIAAYAAATATVAAVITVSQACFGQPSSFAGTFIVVNVIAGLCVIVNKVCKN